MSLTVPDQQTESPDPGPNWPSRRTLRLILFYATMVAGTGLILFAFVLARYPAQANDSTETVAEPIWHRTLSHVVGPANTASLLSEGAVRLASATTTAVTGLFLLVRGLTALERLGPSANAPLSPVEVPPPDQL